MNPNETVAPQLPGPLPTDLSLDEDLAMLLASAAGFCRDQSPRSQVRALLGSDPGFDPATWQAMATLGWGGMAVPEALGGSGLGPGSLAAVAEPAGRHLLTTPFASTQMALQALLASGRADWQQAWVPRLADGAAATVAVLEDDGGWDLARPQARADAQGALVRLSGHKTLVSDAGEAELLLVSVQAPALRDGPAGADGLGAVGSPGAPGAAGAPGAPDRPTTARQPGVALALLPRSALPWGALQREVVADETRRVWRLCLDGVQLPADHLLTGPAADQAIVALQRSAWLLGAAEAVGGLAGVLALLVDYLNTREAFGRKIGSYQGLKHPLADMLVALERSRSLLWHAATLANAHPHLGLADPVLDAALRMAKADAGEQLLWAADRAVQFHGGFGFTHDCDAQLYLRRALWLAPWFGDAAHHRRRLADGWWPVGA